MDRRIRARRQSLNRQRGRRRIGIVFPVVLLLCAGALFLWLRSSDVFAVKKISATATERVTQEDIGRVASSVMGESLLRLSTGELEAALLQLPYVSSAEVYRCFPDTLEVRLGEYEPAARLETSSGDMWLLADDGRALEESPAEELAELPLIVAEGSFPLEPGERVPDPVADTLPLAGLLRSQEIGERLPTVDRVQVSRGGQIVVWLEGGTEIRLGGPTDFVVKLAVATDILEACAKEGKALEYVDASVPARVAVKAK